MKEIIGFIKTYYHEVNKRVLIISTFFISALIWLNYQHSLQARLLYDAGLPIPQFSGHFLVYAAGFIIPYLLYMLFKSLNTDRNFLVCLLIAPAVFAIKVSIDTSMNLAADDAWNEYWNHVIYWPARMIVMLGILALIYAWLHKGQNFYGLSSKSFNAKPYFVMLLIMVPLIAAASTQADFLSVYPKMKTILPLPDGATPGWLYKILFELSYGTDFFSIELFFRGFLIIGFIKWVGKDAIIPMACFYCTIHFGKPLGECISSYFGGLLLGIVSYHTRSVYGGLLVHLGIAWLMEAGGYFGNMLKH
jgi:hypothetical protein